ncbi:MAG: hypothetical protein IPM54_27210 [Polyangiaceae bacterium]|nr:hypothetical protein [Polyangiaceae bacterium]
MKPLDVTQETALPVLRALKTMAVADGRLEARKRAFVDGYQEDAGLSLDFDSIENITPDALAASITDQDLRTAIVQRMVIVALLDEEAHPKEIEALRAFAKALGVSEPAIHQMELARYGHVRRLAFDMLRHGFLARVFRNEWNARGLRGILSSVRGMSGGKNAAIAAKFRALGDLPLGTLGTHYMAYMAANRFPLPGEPKGAPEMLIFHDIGHALTGYSTDVPGEMRMAGFEAGYMREDGFGVVALGLFGFHMGIPLPNIAACRGGFDMEAIEQGYRLGRRLNVDLRGWDPWPYMDRHLDEVRAALGLDGEST